MLLFVAFTSFWAMDWPTVTRPLLFYQIVSAIATRHDSLAIRGAECSDQNGVPS